MTRTSTRRVRLWLGVGALLAPAAVLATASPSNAALPAECHYVGSGPGVECDYGPGAYAFVAPVGVTSVDVTVTGASGGAGSGGAAGGAGAVVHQTYVPAAGLTIKVGGKGGNATGAIGGTAGSNGGATGGNSGTGGAGGGSGGWSGVQDGAFVVLAGGGGGGGGAGAGPGAGTGGAGGSAGPVGAGGNGANGTAGPGSTAGAGGTGGVPNPLAGTGANGGNGLLSNGAGGASGGGAAAGAPGNQGTGNNGGGGGGGSGASIGGGTYARGPFNSPGLVVLRYNACVSHAVVSVGNASVVEGNAGPTIMNFPIHVSNPSSCGAMTVKATTEDITATSPADYAPLAAQVVNIPAGANHANVQVTVNGDTAVEPDETFRLTLSDLLLPAGLTDPGDPVNNFHLGDAVAIGTIIDDDDQIAECSLGTPPPAGYNPIMGTNGPDKLIGTPGKDIIYGLGGDDLILGGHGDDILCGGGGYDEILGGAGNDRISGGEGNDLLYGGSGIDQIVGDGGNNEIHQ